MKYNDNFKRLFKLSESMEIEIACKSNELNCNEEDLLDAILIAFFWNNYEPLKFLYRNNIKEPKK